MLAAIRHAAAPPAPAGLVSPYAVEISLTSKCPFDHRISVAGDIDIPAAQTRPAAKPSAKARLDAGLRA